MAFRELRNFCEIMRSLGYPRLISMENFRTPNFELVADILYWLVQRYDPDADINPEIAEESDRINFTNSVSQFFLSKARIRLNIRKLYQADGYAVQELLKIAKMLNKAVNSSAVEDEEASNIYTVLDLAASSKLQNLKGARSLATIITESGAKLFDLLSREKELREAREKSLGFLDNISRNLDSEAEQEYIRRCIRDIIQGQTGDLTSMERMLKELEADEKSLEAKITKRRAELERAEKRMRSLQTVRPAFMDEYDRLEQELEKMYESYVLKYRNLAYLEHDLEDYSAKEEEKMREANKMLEEERKVIQDEELRILRGEQEIDETNTGPKERKAGKPPAKPAVAQRPDAAHRPNRQQLLDEDSDELSSDEDLIGEVDEDSEDLQGEDPDEMESDSTDNDF